MRTSEDRLRGLSAIGIRNSFQIAYCFDALQVPDAKPKEVQ